MNLALRAPSANPYPGRSTSRQVLLIVKILMSLVNPGVGETRARSSLPESRFSNDDLPTLDRPMKANSGRDSSGHESRSGALQSKMADEMFTIGNQQTTIAANPIHGYSFF